MISHEDAEDNSAAEKGGTHVYVQDPRNEDILVLIRDGVDRTHSLVRGSLLDPPLTTARLSLKPAGPFACLSPSPEVATRHRISCHYLHELQRIERVFTKHSQT
jgi:hypothetical protein